MLMEKWYVYKHYIPDIFVPLCWGESLLEFDTEEAAREFVRVAEQELGLDSEDVVIENIKYFDIENAILNATYLRACAKDDHTFLRDIREG